MMIKTSDEREHEIMKEVIAILRKYLSPNLITLFGSRAKNKSYKNSDFDFAIDRKKPNLRLRRKISEEIEKVAGLYNVDIVYLNNVDKEFKNIIIKTGKILYEK